MFLVEETTIDQARKVKQRVKSMIKDLPLFAAVGIAYKDSGYFVKICFSQFVPEISSISNNIDGVLVETEIVGEFEFVGIPIENSRSISDQSLEIEQKSDRQLLQEMEALVQTAKSGSVYFDEIWDSFWEIKDQIKLMWTGAIPIQPTKKKSWLIWWQQENKSSKTSVKTKNAKWAI